MVEQDARAEQIPRGQIQVQIVDMPWIVDVPPQIVNVPAEPIEQVRQIQVQQCFVVVLSASSSSEKDIEHTGIGGFSDEDDD